MDQKPLPEDFKEFIALLNSNKLNLLKNKRVSGRHRDLADVENLEGEE